jgi:hypothetical protein
MLNRRPVFARWLILLAGLVALAAGPLQAVVTDKQQWLNTQARAPGVIARVNVPVNGSYVAMVMSDSGKFTIGTVSGDPGRSSDDNQRLLFGHPFPGTSDTMVRVDGISQSIHGSTQSVTVAGNSVSITLPLATVSVFERLTIQTSQATGNQDAVQIYFRVTNTDSVAHNVSLRTQLDTQLGANDGAPFRIPNYGPVTTDTEFDNNPHSTAPAIPPQALVVDNLVTPGIISLFTFPDAGFITPDRVVFGAWPISVGQWDYSIVAGRSITNDTSVIVWWGYPDANAFTLAPGATREFAILYGLGNCTPTGAGSLSILFCGPATMNGSLQAPNFLYTPISLTAFFTNAGATAVTGATANLLMTPDFSLVPGYTAHHAIEDTPSAGVLTSSASTQVDWQLTTYGRYVGPRQVSLQVTNGAVNTLRRGFTVTSIPNAVYGQATDESGAPIAGATVTVLQGSTVVGSDVTQANGTYAVGSLPPGAYSVRLTIAGRPDTFAQATVGAGTLDGRTGNPGAFATAANLQSFSYPNPVHEGSAHITFFIETAQSAEVKIFTSAGQLIKTLAVPAAGAGWQSVDWRIDDVANGVYFYQVSIGTTRSRGKIAVIKRRSL